MASDYRFKTIIHAAVNFVRMYNCSLLLTSSTGKRCQKQECQDLTQSADQLLTWMLAFSALSCSSPWRFENAWPL